MILTRQNMPTLDRTKYASAEGVERGGYTLIDAASGKPQVILIATGSELSLACDAFEQLTKDGIAARVVSMPSMELFEMQDAAYREQVLPRGLTARVAVEAASSFGWAEWTGLDGAIVAVDRFGLSAPAAEAMAEVGITPEAVAAAARGQLQRYEA
jgi:transketolase